MMGQPWWWYIPIVGYVIVARRCARSQRAIQAYHDRGELAPPAVMQANAAAYGATSPALEYTLVWLLGLFLAALLVGFLPILVTALR